MGRKRQAGIDYFSHDTHPDDDEALAFIEAKHKANGYLAYFRMLELIYRGEGYYIKWTKRTSVLNAHRFHMDAEELDTIISDMVEEGLFNRGIWEKHSVLTSKSVQIRYLEAVLKRARVNFQSSILLLTESEMEPPTWARVQILVDEKPVFGDPQQAPAEHESTPGFREDSETTEEESVTTKKDSGNTEKDSSGTQSTVQDSTGKYRTDRQTGQEPKECAVGPSVDFKSWLVEYAKSSPGIRNPQRFTAAILKAGPEHESWSELQDRYREYVAENTPKPPPKPPEKCPECGGVLWTVGDRGRCSDCGHDFDREGGAWVPVGDRAEAVDAGFGEI